eukprot:TRINITY_DN621_c0_g1_i2.p1 TRINITY_DN621_c0_g1~~TRINITY_DN621_c0_g1_i2.p1  ORF type:complete len:359 (-),score=83.26 TRINITY_DN621_c0_g1_i2:190-1266(-)
MSNTQIYSWRHDINLIGHRGFGSSKQTFIRENTMLSFSTAHQFGIQFVEFDVHITSDGVPVIYHDFDIPIHDTGIKTSIGNLTLEQFKSLSPNVVKSGLVKDKDVDSSPSSSPSSSGSSKLRRVTYPSKFERSKWLVSDTNVMATLQQLFEELPKEIGFNVELKYPYHPRIGSINPRERNEYLDIILKLIFDVVGDRKLYFSSFDPDICILCSRKQAKYPVFFLTEGHDHGDHQYDNRCTSLGNALKFASQVGLRGIVSENGAVLREIELVKDIHKEGLLIFTYGGNNNKPDIVKTQLDGGVDAIIADKLTRVSKSLKGRTDGVIVNSNDVQSRVHMQKQTRAIVTSTHSLGCHVKIW